MSDVLDNPRVQAALARLDAERDAVADADLEAILRTDHGRRFVRHVVFGLCRLAEPSAVVGGMDGMMAALVTYRNEGLREAGQVLGRRAERVGGELWDLTLSEGRAEALKEDERRREAIQSSIGEP